MCVFVQSVRSYRQKKCVLGKVRCLTIIPGVLAAAFGMSIYVFMETDENYPYTHSLWHVCMSLSCVFLLPSATRRAAGMHLDTGIITGGLFTAMLIVVWSTLI